MSEATEKSESVKRALRKHEGGYYWDIASDLEAEGWTYSPPKPVLPVVSEAAVRAYDAAYSESGVIAFGLRAAFKVMLRENLERTYATDMTYRCYPATPASEPTSHDVYRRLTGEEWR